LGHRVHLKSKGRGEKSMHEKRWYSEDVEEEAMQDPRTMVKADCFKPNPQMDYFGSHRYNICYR
jgi:hypothetical protein